MGEASGAMAGGVKHSACLKMNCGERARLPLLAAMAGGLFILIGGGVSDRLVSTVFMPESTHYDRLDYLAK
jgi:hypothetical protein